MTNRQSSTTVTVGDWMPRVTLPLLSGSLFDSWDPDAAGLARVYWLGLLGPPADTQLATQLAACETLLHVVVTAPPSSGHVPPSCLIDRLGELGRAFGSTGSLAILVDPAGRVAALLSAPTPDAIAAFATRLYRASAPVVVQAKAPVLMLDRVIDPTLCRTLIDYWDRNDKVASIVGSDSGNIVNNEAKRRHDVQVADPRLFAQLRDCLVRRVVPAILQAFHIGILVIEAPMIGCYDADEGGWFRRHRDNTSAHTAHRQFAVSLNLNPDDEYEGGEIRFPEFGRELYRPAAGSMVVFSSSLLHEVVPVRRGRRFGAFTFLSASGPRGMAQRPTKRA
jgi:predicted 2-oxoglutarate/Fe(II)-dependent dioxygenase YbiX